MFFCCVSIIYFIFLIFLICFNDITVSFLAKNGNVWYIINDDEMKETKKKEPVIFIEYVNIRHFIRRLILWTWN